MFDVVMTSHLNRVIDYCQENAASFNFWYDGYAWQTDLRDPLNGSDFNSSGQDLGELIKATSIWIIQND